MFLHLIFPGLGSLVGLTRGMFGFIGDSATGSLASLALMTLPLVCKESTTLAVLVTPPLVSRGSPSSGLLAVDNPWAWGGELVSASAVHDSCSSESELVGDSSSLRGRGMDTLLSVLTWGFLWRSLKAVLLYVMSNLGLNTHVDAVEQVLWGELLLDLL